MAYGEGVRMSSYHHLEHPVYKVVEICNYTRRFVSSVNQNFCLSQIN